MATRDTDTVEGHTYLRLCKRVVEHHRTSPIIVPITDRKLGTWGLFGGRRPRPSVLHPALP